MDDKKSENSDFCLITLDLLLHVLVLHHVMQFRNFYLVFLSVSQCQGIAPCYATLELIDFLEISVTDVTDIVSSRDPPDLKSVTKVFLIVPKCS